MTALAWITNYRPWKLYVRNRVETIRRLSEVNYWRHCPGEINPADLPTRGVSAKKLANNQLWWEGPEFLKEDLEQLPKTNAKIDELVLKQAVINPPDVTYSLVSKLKVENVVEFDRFSSKQKLLRVVAYLLRFVTNLKSLIFSDSTAYKGELKPSEIQSAENIIIKQIQAQNFPEEICYLPGKRSSTISAYIQTFNLFFDDNGLLRCRTRLQNVQLNAVEKNPVLIPTHTSYADLIIKESHHKVFHSGIAQTLRHLRTKYWVPRARQKTKSLIRKCFTCKRIDAGFCNVPPPPPLPSFPVADSVPSVNSGLDFIGPLYIRSDSGEINQVNKSYILLFTSCCTRNIHLEICKTLNFSSFCLAFRRFSSYYGVPTFLISENATTFKQAAQEIRKIVRSKEVERFLTNKGTSWNHIVERAS